MKWGEENGDRKAIVRLAENKFNEEYLKNRPENGEDRHLLNPKQRFHVKPRRTAFNKDLEVSEKSDILKSIRGLSDEDFIKGESVLFKNDYLYIFNFPPTIESFEENLKDGDGFEIIDKINLNKLTEEEQNEIRTEFEEIKDSFNSILARNGYEKRNSNGRVSLVKNGETIRQNDGLDSTSSRGKSDNGGNSTSNENDFRGNRELDTQLGNNNLFSPKFTYTTHIKESVKQLFENNAEYIEKIYDALEVNKNDISAEEKKKILTLYSHFTNTLPEGEKYSKLEDFRAFKRFYDKYKYHTNNSELKPKEKETIFDYIKTIEDRENGQGIFDNGEFVYQFNFSPNFDGDNVDYTTYKSENGGKDGFEVKKKANINKLTKEQIDGIQNEFGRNLDSISPWFNTTEFESEGDRNNNETYKEGTPDKAHDWLDKGQLREETNTNRSNNSSNRNIGRDTRLGVQLEIPNLISEIEGSIC